MRRLEFNLVKLVIYFKELDNKIFELEFKLLKLNGEDNIVL